jgi:hypothetical protein
MAANTCSECDRLWREIGQAAHQNFRLEARLRRAEDRHDTEVASIMTKKLANLAVEQARIHQALIEHENREHMQQTGPRP